MPARGGIPLPRGSRLTPVGRPTVVQPPPVGYPLGTSPWSTDTGRSDGINKYPCTGGPSYIPVYPLPSTRFPPERLYRGTPVLAGI